MHWRRRGHRPGAGAGLTLPRTIWLLAAPAALAACSEQPAGEGQAQRQPPAAPGVWVPEAGTYEFTRSNGASGLIMLSGDSRYTAAMSGGELEDGVWRREGPLSCLTPQERVEDKHCYTFTAPDARGRYRGIAGDGGTISVRKLE